MMNAAELAASALMDAPLFKAIFENMAEGILVFDPEGRMIFKNRAAGEYSACRFHPPG
jgi:PAS domain-containing protein